MIHVSPSPIEVGVFDIAESQMVVQEILRGDMPTTSTEYSGRMVIDDAVDVACTLQRIELMKIDESLPQRQKLRTRIYAQNFAEIDEEKFPGLAWHIDVAGQSSMNCDPMDFYFGSSTHPTELFVGILDLTEARRHLNQQYKEQFDVFPDKPAMIIRWAPELAAQAIGESVEKGNGYVLEAHPGVLYKIEKGIVHRMQPFEKDRIYPARFCIEQYLV